MSTPRDFHRPNLSKNQNPSDEKPTRQRRGINGRRMYSDDDEIAENYRLK